MALAFGCGAACSVGRPAHNIGGIVAARKMGKEGMGGSGDLRDRMRNAYKPGANPAPAEFGNPVEQVKGLLKRKKRKPVKPAA